MYATEGLLGLLSKLCNSAPDMDAEFFFDLVDKLQWEAFKLGYMEATTELSYLNEKEERVVGLTEVPLRDTLARCADPDGLQRFKHLFAIDDERSDKET